MCAADTSLEHGHVSFDPQTNLTSYFYDGEGAVHKCKDWSRVSAFLVQNRVNDKKGILGV